ncbi:hypothetical protein H696_03628 [Fonticula alba]|uniref:Uncharacterized protein n=1 Tax=Fonticula alba TaxID=691883 RepID=A0A058Z795_FONAL|nr:hypothetical protein H696_03628 [Fonticula alba]KCV70169.1 hypothetical protein H696_03628 [Fonticula alba]|eukprot:XP_009495775.1 hypothetical protein H696_03628 [Fonticula alba]
MTTERQHSGWRPNGRSAHSAPTPVPETSYQISAHMLRRDLAHMHGSLVDFLTSYSSLSPSVPPANPSLFESLRQTRPQSSLARSMQDILDEPMLSCLQPVPRPPTPPPVTPVPEAAGAGSPFASAVDAELSAGSAVDIDAGTTVAASPDTGAPTGMGPASDGGPVVGTCPEAGNGSLPAGDALSGAWPNQDTQSSGSAGKGDSFEESLLGKPELGLPSLPQYLATLSRLSKHIFSLGPVSADCMSHITLGLNRLSTSVQDIYQVALDLYAELVHVGDSSSEDPDQSIDLNHLLSVFSSIVVKSVALVLEGTPTLERTSAVASFLATVLSICHTSKPLVEPVSAQECAFLRLPAGVPPPAPVSLLWALLQGIVGQHSPRAVWSPLWLLVDVFGMERPEAGAAGAAGAEGPALEAFADGHPLVDYLVSRGLTGCGPLGPPERMAAILRREAGKSAVQDLPSGNPADSTESPTARKTLALTHLYLSVVCHLDGMLLEMIEDAKYGEGSGLAGPSPLTSADALLWQWLAGWGNSLQACTLRDGTVVSQPGQVATLNGRVHLAQLAAMVLAPVVRTLHNRTDDGVADEDDVADEDNESDEDDVFNVDDADALDRLLISCAQAMANYDGTGAPASGHLVGNAIVFLLQALGELQNARPMWRSAKAPTLAWHSPQTALHPHPIAGKALDCLDLGTYYTGFLDAGEPEGATCLLSSDLDFRLEEDS